MMNYRNLLATKNYSSGSYDDFEKINCETLTLLGSNLLNSDLQSIINLHLNGGYLVRQSCPDLSEHQLKQAIMFVNKQQLNGRTCFSLELQAGDELVLLSPLCGG